MELLQVLEDATATADAAASAEVAAEAATEAALAESSQAHQEGTALQLRLLDSQARTSPQTCFQALALPLQASMHAAV